jgi:spore germination protein KB
MLKINNLFKYKNRDMYYVVINLLTYRIFTRFPILFAKTAATAASLSALYSGLIALIIIFFASRLFSGNNHRNIIDEATLAFGNTGRYIVALIILIYISISAFVALNEFSIFSKAVAFPTSPLSYILIFFVVASLTASLTGIKTTIRLHGVFMPLVLLGIVLLLVSTLYKGNPSNIIPILGKNCESLFGKGISGIVFYTDIILFFAIAPEKKNTPQRNILLWGTITGIIINFLFVLSYNLTIPYPISADGQFPIYLLLKEVYYGRFFQRIDAIVLFISNISGMLYLCFNLGIFSHILKQVFNVKKSRTAVIIYSIIIFLTVLFNKLIPSQLITVMMFLFGFAALAFMLTTVFFARRKSKYEKI